MAVEKFEVSLKKLEDAVNRLESGDLSLDDSLRVFEEGVKHASLCSRKLNEAQKKVELLLKRKDGSLYKEEFQVDAKARSTPNGFRKRGRIHARSRRQLAASNAAA
jgi:exodeoxyribonuclease VII small subunit